MSVYPQSGVLTVSSRTDDFGICITKSLDAVLSAARGPRLFVFCLEVVLGRLSTRPHEVLGAGDASLYDTVVSADNGHWFLASSAQARPCAVLDFVVTSS